jgi:dipeptide transport system ATP-binding protein
MVMYAGQVVETGPVDEVFRHPRHPYTAALMAALPGNSRGRDRLQTIPGVVPGKYDRPSGCLLSPRCFFATERCRLEPPRLEGPAQRQVRCHTPLDDEGQPT